MQIEDKIRTIVEPFLDEDLFLVDIQVSMGKMTKVLILVDGDQGVSIKQCASISRRLAAVLEEDELFEAAYNLEVSSPGVDQPLNQLRQYVKNIGRKVKVTLNDDDEVTGELMEATEEKIVLNKEIKGKGKKVSIEQAEIPLNSIKKTNVLISFN